MARPGAIVGLLMLATFLAGTAETRGQSVVSLADEIIVISQGQRTKEEMRDTTELGPVHGSVETPFGSQPGRDESRLGFHSPVRRELDVLSAASQRTSASTPMRERPTGVLPTPLPPSTETPPPLYGPIDVLTGAEVGPGNGMTLDEAILRVVRDNPDLAVKFHEIPKAEADILSASLWANPLFFATAGSVPYGSYSPNRPGSNNYGVTLIQPFDVNGKIRARTILARQAKKVLEAQYQDAVRLEIDHLYNAFVETLAAYITLDYLSGSLRNYEVQYATIQDRVQRGAAPESDLDAAIIQRETVVNAREQAESRLRQSKRRLAVLLRVPPQQADALEVRGSLRPQGPPVPPVPELIRIALCNRPDVVAFTLAIRSATANVNVQRRERFPDVFALYSPYEFTANNDVYSHRSATAWSAGIFGSIPLVNRNQGNIRRAEHNVMQTQIELDALRARVAGEVENAAIELNTSHNAVDRFERIILPRARHLRDDKRRLFEDGQESLDVYLSAQRDFNDVVRMHRDALVRLRLDSLRLNTAVGRRLIP